MNRYYDPTVDEFLSVDSDVAATDQPYVFTNDNPLNETDSLGDDPPMMITTAEQKEVKVEGVQIDLQVEAMESAIHESVTRSAGPVPVSFGGLSLYVTASVVITGPETSAKVKMAENGTVSVTVDGVNETFSPVDAEVSFATQGGQLGVSLSANGLSATSTSTLYSSLLVSVTASITVTLQSAQSPQSGGSDQAPSATKASEIIGGLIVIGGFIIAVGKAATAAGAGAG